MQDIAAPIADQLAGQAAARPGHRPADLEDHGRWLAEKHRLQISVHPVSHTTGLISSRLDGYEALLKETAHHLQAQTSETGQISTAAEWMLDNYYVAMQALREVRKDLPPRYEHQLPRLQNPDSASVSTSQKKQERHAAPLRIYDLAREIIYSEQALLDIGRVQRFVGAYQTVLPLTMGELWAVPIMLWLGILETLLAAIAGLTQTQAGEIQSALPGAGAIEGGSGTAQNGEHLVVENSIRSLRALAVQDWKAFFESLSLVENILAQDPAGLYQGMDFATRDRYRKAAEEIAVAADADEVTVARQVINLALQAQGRTADRASKSQERLRPATPGWDHFRSRLEEHVGFYLLGAGRSRLEDIVANHARTSALQRFAHAHRTLVYLGSIVLLTLGQLPIVMYISVRITGSTLQLPLIFLLALVPTVTIAVDLVNWAATQIVPPRMLARMDFSRGIPQECMTLIVIPALIYSPQEITSLLEQLEQHYLRNPDPQFRFALLTDFPDAPSEDMPGDEELLQHVRQGIQQLNGKYKSGGSGQPGSDVERFVLLHRNRRWNAAEQVWMGWERKRGKLHELNQLILAAQDGVGDGAIAAKAESFPIREGNLDFLSQVRYVITLDADTMLPRDSARELVATLAHPLNRARFNSDGSEEDYRQVETGYTIIQPRTEINPISSGRSRFTRILSGDAGLDLYTQAVSDVYQDLFGEGIYVGKGAYDVRAFEHSLQGSVPENALLSHDLFEGIHGRVALATGIVLIEDLPPTYLVHAERLSRWQRGDWQLLPWAFSRRLSLINRWKIWDNLRRSLVAPALLLWLLVGWIVLPDKLTNPIYVGAWTLAVLPVLAVPLLTGLWTMLRRRFTSQTLSQAYSLKNVFFRWLLAWVFLPYEAWISLSALLTTLIRLTITHHGLLQWMPSHLAIRRLGHKTALAFWGQMIFSPILVIILAPLIYLMHADVLSWAAPFLLAWLLAPGVSAWLSRPLLPRSEHLRDEQVIELRRLACQTWLFFEQFDGPEDHWLPPDHFQENPLGTVAHRTSPTNIGLGLLSVLGAYDLGYIDLLSLVTRLQSTLDTLEKLERYQGHFLNWYDTRSLKPLSPRYVSTVDSGNLAACLLALREGCLEILQRPVLCWETFEGLLDALGLLDGTFRDLEGVVQRSMVSRLRQNLATINQAIMAVKDKPGQWMPLLLDLGKKEASQSESHPWLEMNRLIVDLVRTSAEQLGAENLRRIRLYHQHVQQQMDNSNRLVEMLLPWLISWQNMPDLLRADHMPASLAAIMQTLEAPFSEQLSLSNMSAAYQSSQAALEQLCDLSKRGDGSEWGRVRTWTRDLVSKLNNASMTAKAITISLTDLAGRCETLVSNMNFHFLFDNQRQVFHIGYNVTNSNLDANYYDLLASEARLASLVAIAKGDVPKSHWLHMARPFTRVSGRQALISWSGTMFEYLMPRLLVHSDAGTLLGQTLEAVTDYQIQYGLEKKVPWGISESGYYRFDLNQFYQYRAFGVPGLGYKRGLADDLVVAPYASLLALPLRPRAVVRNMQHLRRCGMQGVYGFYEAIDFTPARLELGQKAAIVRSYMVHHQGMILLSLVNYLKGDAMVKRFQADPRIQSVDLLLLEQIPRGAPIEQPNPGTAPGLRLMHPRLTAIPWQVDPQASQPAAHYLSNGRYSVLATASGGGYSVWKDVDLTRWRADSSLDNWGTWIYIQDRATGWNWSSTLQPDMKRPDEYRVFFNGHTAEYHRRDGNLAQTTVVFVAPDDDVEIRRVSLANHGDRPRRLRLTSYGEVILAPQATDARHPAFNKMFIECETLAKKNGLLFHRRPRDSTEAPLYLAHAVVMPFSGLTSLLPANPPTLESDRRRFLGRNRTIRNPIMLESNRPPDTGPSLDPIFSVSQDVLLPPHGSIQLAFLTVAARSAMDCQSILDRYTTPDAIRTALERAQSLVEVEMNKMEVSSARLKDFQTLLSLLVFPSQALRAAPERLSANQEGQPGLWPFAISGDYPILLAEFGAKEELELARDLLQAHEYWRRRGLMIDLVILNTQDTGYSQELNSQLYRLIVNTENDAWLNRRGGIFLLQTGQMNEADRVLLETAARVVLDGSHGSLANLLQHAPALHYQPASLPLFSPVLHNVEEAEATSPTPRPAGLLHDNGLGGFSPDGREYCIYLEEGQATPAPWTNIIANPQFGFLITESGLGMTWAGNSGENRLTLWSNDPVSNEPHEALYLRDEETAQVWSPTPLPAPAPAPYLIRHGAGYTTFEHRSHGLDQQVRLFTPPDAPLKIIQVRLENTWQRPRRITLTYYAEWALGLNREDAQQYIISEYSSKPQALLARNPYNTEFAERVAFAAASKSLHGLTADRSEFLGRSGSYEKPSALGRIGLSGTVRAGLDPCSALQLHLDLQPGASETVYFLLGQAADRQAALRLIKRYQDPEQVASAWQASNRFWEDLLEAVRVETPEPSFDLILNRWLLYQTLACRIWGRSAFYQSSGAYGFRDQLQDVLALLYVAPDIARDHLLRAARHQFEAGDVLHWWHPPFGRGVRTRCSDDLLWLPYVTAEYVQVTGDEAILGVKIPFRRAPLLEQGQEERYGQYPETEETYTIFEHCRRALEKGTTSGPHNLPLMGSGDWNDGMNRVGSEGRGESVWLGWFLYITLNRFADLCERHGQPEPAAGYRQQAADLAQAIEKSAWNGDWYLRAFYDDGSPLGSAKSQECQIDSIAQSWAVLSGAGDPQHILQAMDSVSRRLVRADEQLVLLFTPPFDKSPQEPGYIKGYRPGIRENGGQYTHAALWAAWAMAELGRTDDSFKLFQILNPITHSDDTGKAALYRVEPYVVAADVYGAAPFTGQGGWTWYTGSSGWMYRLGVEEILGLKKRGNWLELDPHIPAAWPGFHITYRLGKAIYDITVENPGGVDRGVSKVTLDGQDLPEKKIPLVQDETQRSVVIVLGSD